MNAKIETLMQNLPNGVDAALIVSDENRRYYTAFPSTAGILFVTRDEAYFLIDSRYIEAAKAVVSGCTIELLEHEKEQLAALCKKHDVKTVASENTYLTVKAFDRYAQELAPAILTRETALDNTILSQRKIKTADELEKLRAAQALTDETFAHILNFIRPGMTEREIALEMEFFMRKNGAEGVSFEFIVVAGTNTSLPHGVPTNHLVKKGDFITMDFGALLDGYHADMTRTIALGSILPEQKKLYDTVLRAQTESLAAVRLGMACNAVDKVARDIIYGAGYEGHFGHGLGHSVGVEIHEEPRFSPTCTELVEPGLVMTVEPGIYLEGRFGCRIEDMISITENGIENMTHSPKELITL